jgi:hypothetical protein
MQIPPHTGAARARSKNDSSIDSPRSGRLPASRRSAVPGV